MFRILSPYRFRLPSRVFFMLGLVIFATISFVLVLFTEFDPTFLDSKLSQYRRQQNAIDKSFLYKSKFLYEWGQNVDSKSKSIIQGSTKLPAYTYKDTKLPNDDCLDGYVTDFATSRTCGTSNHWSKLEEKSKKFKCIDFVQVPNKAKRTRFQLLTPYNRTVRSDAELLESTKKCQDLVPTNPYVRSKLKVAYIILTHRKAEQFLKTLMTIYVPQNVYLIHVDERATYSFKRVMENIANCFSNVFILPKSYAVSPGGISQLRVDVESMSFLLNTKWDYLINIQGTDYPLRSNDEVANFLEKLNGHSMITSFVDKKLEWRTKYVYDESPQEETIYRYANRTKSFNIQSVLPFHHGKAFNIYSRRFAEFADIQKNPVAQAMFEFSMYSYLPAEQYWATLAKLEPKMKRKKLIRTDRMGLRYTRRAAKPSSCSTGVSRYNTCVYGIQDLQELLLFRDFYLFAGEFSLEIDHMVFRCVDAAIMKAAGKPKKTKTLSKS